MFVSNGSLVGIKTPFLPDRPASYFPVMSSPTWPSAYGGMFERHLWVYVVVMKRAKGTARLPLKVYERRDGDRPTRNDHPLFRLLDNPNPALSGFDLWQWTSATFDIYGETFWYKKRTAGGMQLYPLHPSGMSETPDGWRFDNGRLKLEGIPDRDLVRFWSFSPSSFTRGLSPLEPLRSTLEAEWGARTATSSFWNRGARPGFALSHPSTMSEQAQHRLRAQFERNHGGAANVGSTLILEEGLKADRLDLTAEEAAYIDSRKLNREEVCAAYDVPPPVVHILDRATFSNITEQMRSMYRDTMAPHLRGFEATIETQLRAVDWPNDPVYAEFLLDGVLRGDFEARQEAYAKADYMTLAEKREKENLPFIPGTDRIFLNTAVMPLDAIDAATEAQRSLPASVVRTVLGRLGWQQDVSQVDLNAITRGLHAAHADQVAAVVATASTMPALRAALREGD